MSDYEILNPDPAALVESLRAFGYTTSTAIADLVDNSVTANAKNVWVDFLWDGPASWIRIDDDGYGMTEEELVAAMRPGSRSPLEERDPRDLGRFGLGLKSASFSQCRLLTVRSRKPNDVFSARVWDLDVVQRSREWRLQLEAGPRSADVLDLAHSDANTSVLWERIDRVVDGRSVDDQGAHRQFLALIEEVQAHLAMTFHRFMSKKRLPIRIWINGNLVVPWDPFLANESTTQRLQVDPVWFAGIKLLVQPYVLPHHSKISAETHRRASGPRGWNAHQGFYVYRNERLLLPGDWLGLGLQKEEHYKLARIQVDLPNSMDDAWNIDVKKAVARPPGALRPDLQRIARATREVAAGVYRFRGKQLARAATGPYAMVWQQRITREKVHYRINREHPLVVAARSLRESSGPVDALLRLVEETVPTSLITMSQNEQETAQAEPFDSAPSDVIKVMREVYQALLASGLSPEESVHRLAVMEPFGKFPDVIAALTEETGPPR